MNKSSRTNTKGSVTQADLLRDGRKRCSKCSTVKTIADFSRNRARYDGLAIWCKPCVAAYSAAWRERPGVKERQARLAAERYQGMSDEERAEYIRAGVEQRRVNDYHLSRKYGMSRRQYEEMLERQGGGCAICAKRPDPGRRLSVDHDHQCCPGATTCGSCVRGLLCITCNVWLGFYENEEWMTRARKYVNQEIKRLEGANDGR